ncbi:protein phosphatase 2C domain-containing protein [Phthorimaea operculella]|nr:protein phosphatase 2C domain-containing protein [Phthorimaea operculella]
MTEEPGNDSGCTAVVALLKGTELYVANAGDSRCIICREGKAIDMSIDHKPEDAPELERITKAGGKVSNDGRINGGLNLSRAIGDHSYKQNKVTYTAIDHRPEDAPELERITKAGGKVSNDGRINGGLNLSRAIGDHSYKQNKVTVSHHVHTSFTAAY